MLAQVGKFSPGLDTLREEVEAQSARDPGDGLDDIRVSGLDAANEAVVELQRVDGKAAQMAKRRVARAEIVDDDDQAPICSVTLSNPLADFINARGVEIDDKDKGLWITDFGGNLYKITSCSTQPGPSDSGTSASVGAGPAIVDGTLLHQSLPNPFSTGAEISFALPKPMQAKLLVHDMSGRLIEVLADRSFEAGDHSVQFEPQGIPAGLYRYSLILGNGATISKTMVYVK